MKWTIRIVWVYWGMMGVGEQSNCTYLTKRCKIWSEAEVLCYRGF